MRKIINNSIWSRYPIRLVFLVPVFLVCAFFITSCVDFRQKNNSITELFESQDFAMGTFIVQKVYGKNAEEISKKVISEIREIEAKMSINLLKSEISRLNLLSGKGYASLPYDDSTNGAYKTKTR